MFILNRKCSFIWYNNSCGSISMPTCSGAWAIPPHVQLLAFPFVGLYEDSPLQEHGCLAVDGAACTEQGVKMTQKLLRRGSGCSTTVDMPEGKWRSYTWSMRGMSWVGAAEGGYGQPRFRLQGVPGVPGAGSNGVLPTGSVLWLRSWLASWMRC